jgi:3-oxoacyl-[acyl-carrier-protein] synthase-1
MAMHVASEKIANGECDLCLAAGVDSYHDSRTLQWLDETGSLMSAENRSGFPPGEAAGACLLSSRAFAEQHDMPVFARVAAATTALERHAIRGGGVCIGEGLTAALKGVISSLELPREAITTTYCDLNGQRYRSEEFMYTLLRVQGAFVDALDYVCPADCWGDIGAASGLLFASLAIASSERDYAKGPYPLLWAGSESGQRAAVFLKLGDGGERGQ